MAGLILNLSLSARIMVNAEALNMAETVGNYTRHRKAPLVIRSGDTYSIVYVPAVSGESLAHAYQEILAKIASERGLPVTEMDKNGFFIKYSDDNTLGYYSKELAKVLKCDEKDAVAKFTELGPCDIEKTVLKTSVVADVAGFLYTGKSEKGKKSSKNESEKGAPVKRTSAIRFSYMLPAIDAVSGGGVAVTPQLHVRYTPEAKKGEQALFYVESGSALYTLTAQLVISDITRLNYCSERDEELAKEMPKRVGAALDALAAMIDGLLFGAKRSRYNPQWDIASMIVGLSKGPVEFIVSPGITKDYMKKTYERAVALSKILGNEIVVNLYAYNGEDAPKPQVDQSIRNVTLEEASSHTEALAKVRKKVMDLVSLMTTG